MEIQGIEFEGPHLLRREEAAAAHRLAALCFGGFVDAEDAEKRAALYRPPRRGGWQVISHQGTPVCQIGVFHSRLDVYGSPLRIGSIGGVCTHPDYRELRLASLLLEHCARLLTAEGARLMLISGTRGLYTRAGYVTAQDFEYAILRPGQFRPPSAAVALRPATAADAATCARLYQAEPVRFARDVEKFTAHFRHREEYPAAEDWIIERDGRPAAYVFLSIPWDQWPRRDSGVREVFEYAGERIALAASLTEMMARANLRELRVPAPWQDGDLIHLLRAGGASSARIPLIGHTMRLLDFHGLMADLRPYVRARLTSAQRRGLRFEQDGERCVIVRGGERLELDAGAMTRLVMGVPREMAPELDGGPGVVGEIARALFPLPAFLPGLNYQ